MKFADIVSGTGAGLVHSRHHIVRSYVVVPCGILILLTILYGLNQLLANVFKIKFPASVLGMLINLVLLSVLSVVSGTNGAVSGYAESVLKHYLTIVKPSMNFSLKWINVFFIPSFVVLPLSEPITFIECLKIAGVFVFGLLVLFCVNVYVTLGMKKLVNFRSKHVVKTGDEIEMDSANNGVFTSMRDDITTIDITSLISSRSTVNVAAATPPQDPPISENPFVEAVQEPEPVHHKDGISRPTPSKPMVTSLPSPVPSPPPTPSSTLSPSLSSDESPSLDISEDAQKVALFIIDYVDWIAYFTLFIVSLPLYYIHPIHTFLPYHLSLTILSYFAALLIPQRWPATRKFAHPILVLTAETLFVCFIGSMIYHHKPKGFLDDLKYYKTGKNYLNLFSHQALVNNGQPAPHGDTGTPQWPGAGDFLSSLMDISIVSLSLPMFTHRRDFIRNFWVLMPPIVISVALTFFLYPILCHAIGIESGRSIGFIGRSVTLALGTPLILALEGSVSLMAVCTILSGICGVMVGDTLFRLMRVSKNDYVTRGVSFGINCGAVGTAHLLTIDPRAASMSSLSFSIFGTVMVIMASVGAVRDVIRGLVGL